MTFEILKRNGCVQVAASAAFVLVFLSACLPSDPGARGEVGVSSVAGAILLRVQPCDHDALVQSVALMAATGKAGQEGEVLWEIRSESGSLLRDYEIGRTDVGFVETVSPAKIDRDAQYVARVTLVSEELPLPTSFVPSKLEQSKWQISANRSL